MPDAFPMVARCAERQGMYTLNRCECGEPKNMAYSRCPTCDLRDALRRLDLGLANRKGVM